MRFRILFSNFYKRTKSIDFSILWEYLKLHLALLCFRPHRLFLYSFGNPFCEPLSSYTLLRKVYIKLGQHFLR